LKIILSKTIQCHTVYPYLRPDLWIRIGYDVKAGKCTARVICHPYHEHGNFRYQRLAQQCSKLKATLLITSEVAQWLRFCATYRKVAGFIPGGVVGFFR
jgi:hypothetical protein